MQPFTCANNKYRTDTSKGYPHGVGHEKGSFFSGYIRQTESGSLWVEYVANSDGSATDGLWFVWYDVNGRCLTKSSAVFIADDLVNFFDGILRGYK